MTEYMIEYMIEYIYEKSFSIPPEVCVFFINFFENNKNLQDEGRVGDGEVKKSIKDTIDLVLKISPIDNPINKLINNVLINTLNISLKDYLSVTNIQLSFEKFIIDTIQIQKYIVNVGKIENHTDSYVTDNNLKRVFTFIWYLNDVNEGGETLFFEKYSIKPQKGKLVIFPAEWFFQHKGKTPISNDKYIITGWIYM
jgi:hypothetical protein